MVIGHEGETIPLSAYGVAVYLESTPSR